MSARPIRLRRQCARRRAGLAAALLALAAACRANPGAAAPPAAGAMAAESKPTGTLEQLEAVLAANASKPIEGTVSFELLPGDAEPELDPWKEPALPPRALVALTAAGAQSPDSQPAGSEPAAAPAESAPSEAPVSAPAADSVPANASAPVLEPASGAAPDAGAAPAAATAAELAQEPAASAPAPAQQPAAAESSAPAPANSGAALVITTPAAEPPAAAPAAAPEPSTLLLPEPRANATQPLHAPDSAPAPASAELAAADAAARGEPAHSAPLVLPENPYLAFGPRIVVHPDGRVTKPYPVQVKKGKRLLDLLQLYGDFSLRYVIRTPSEPPAPLPAPPDGKLSDVEIMLLEEWDMELYQDMRSWPPPTPGPVSLADWLVVTAPPELLHRVEEFLNLFAASVPQIEIEAQIVEMTETNALDVGVKSVNKDTPILDAPGNKTLFKGLDFGFPTTDPASALLTLGAVQDGLAFNAVLQLLRTWENVSITSQPKIAVREGSKAEIINTKKIPYYTFTGINAAAQYSATLNFEEVGVKLYVVPRVVGTDTIALNIDIEASQLAGSVNSLVTDSGGSVLSNPVIAKRAAKTIVYLQPGQGVIIAGMTTLADTQKERKVPVLGDIPLLGALFRSKLDSKEKTHVLFLIRPRVLQGADFQREF